MPLILTLMTKINSNELLLRLRENAKIHVIDSVPTELAKSVVPVIETNPRLLKYTAEVDGAAKSTSGTLTAVTLLSDKDFYLTSISAGYIKDAACDTATGNYFVQGVLSSKTITFKRFSIITLTEQSSEFNIVFNNPVKLDRGSSITMTGTFAAGVCTRDVSITGYYEG